MKVLTPRQQALYKYLTEKGDVWSRQVDIYNDLIEWYGEYEYNDFHNSMARHKLTEDIRAINDSDEARMIVLSNSQGVKIATKEEFQKYIRKEISSAVRRLLRAKRKAEKGRLDGQIEFTSKAERETIKAFLK